MHTPVLIVAILEGCASVHGHGVVVEDKISRRPLVTVGNSAVIHELGELQAERVALGLGPIHDLHAYFTFGSFLILFIFVSTLGYGE